MKNETMITSIGTIKLVEMEITEDIIDVYIPVVDVSENLKATIKENIQKAKEEYQKEFLDGRGLQWSDAEIKLLFQQLHITIKEKVLTYELCFDFQDAENNFCTGFTLAVDLSEHTEELKETIKSAVLEKFF